MTKKQRFFPTCVFKKSYKFVQKNHKNFTPTSIKYNLNGYEKCFDLDIQFVDK